MGVRKQRDAYTHYANTLVGLLQRLVADPLVPPNVQVALKGDIYQAQRILDDLKTWKEDKEGRGIVYLSDNPSEAHSVLDLYDCAILRMMGHVGDNIPIGAMYRIPITDNTEYQAVAKAKHFYNATAKYHKVDVEDVRFKIPPGPALEIVLKKALKRARFLVDKEWQQT